MHDDIYVHLESENQSHAQRGAADHQHASESALKTASESITPAMLTLVRLDQQHIDSVVERVPGGLKNVQDIYPLSPLQEGMLFHHLLNKQEDSYLLSTLFELDSQSHVTALVGALQAVIDRHDVLRTAVLWEGLPQPVQVVCRRASLTVVEVQLDEKIDEVSQLHERMRPRSQSLDLREAPLMRLQVGARLHQEAWFAVLHVHHLACDHQSLRTLVAEVMKHLDGKARELPPPAPFKLYVEQALASTKPEESKKFFRSRLGDVAEPTAPFQVLDVHGRRSIQEYREVVEDGLAQDIQAQARRTGVSPARLFHAAWALVVARTSGRDDVVFGTVLLTGSQRKLRAQRMLGLSVNTLPLRLKIRGMTAKGLVDQAHAELLTLKDHDAAPLTLAQGCSQVAVTAPLFTSILNFRHSAPTAGGDVAAAGGIRVLERGEAWTNYPLTVTVDDVGTGFVLMAKTDQRIDPARVLTYVCTALRSLIDALNKAPETAATRLSILPHAERQEIIHNFNATRAPYAQDSLVHELFEEQVRRYPDRAAVTHNGESLTFAELNAKANQLARYLRDKGVTPDSLVALFVGRSLDFLVGLWGVLKAGAAYVPIDPTNPRERVAHLLDDAKPRVILTKEALKVGVPDSVGDVTVLDGDWHHIAKYADDNLTRMPLQTARSLAYVIYTSGSTGKPKGVMVEHRSIVNYATHALAQFDVSSGNGSLICTSVSFDLMLTGLYPVLLGGKTVRMCAEERSGSGLLEDLIGCSNLAPLKLTPSHLALLETPLRSGTLAGRVRVLVLGGEALHGDTARLWRTHAPGTRIFNHYGPTEATVGCIVHEIKNDAAGAIPIGRPISNAQIYILDEFRDPVPIGVAGEIYIAGDGLARGYWNRSELTAERFVINAFSSDAQARMYRTGDLGRWHANGSIEYLGRNDHQVKVRGFRVELGEIEAQLMKFSGVQRAAVIAREDSPGDRRLVAYVVTSDGRSLAIAALRDHLQASMPEYMVPNAFVFLDSLPLTPNGKLDRRALPVPDLAAHSSRHYEAPQGELEHALAAIWQTVLQVDRVGRHDNFFELGGHSLLIMKMMDRICRLGLSAELHRVFESRSLADLANVLEQDGTSTADVPPPRIPEGAEAITPGMLPLIDLDQEHINAIVESIPGGAKNVQEIYPLVPLQEGILFHFSLLREEQGDMYVVPVVLSMSSRERLNELIAALQSVVNRHDMLRTAILWEHLPQPVQVVCRQASLSVEELPIRPGSDPVDQMREWLSPERQRLDPRQAPLIRVRVTEDSTGRCYALIQTHHLAADHVALEILIAEVVAHLEGKAETLQPPVPYRNHVAYALLNSRRHNAEEFFRGKLCDVDEPSAPFGVLDVRGSGARIQERTVPVEANLGLRIRGNARRFGVSAATVFHAAWSLVVARTSERDDVVFGTVLLGRMHGGAQAAATLGMFINTLPIRLPLRNLTIAELLSRAQKELIELLPYEQASLAVAQRCSGVSGAAPLFTSLLNYRHSASRFEAMWSRADGIEATAAQGRTNYPITLSIDDTAESFSLTAQTDASIDPNRIIDHVTTCLCSLVDALEQTPNLPAVALSTLPTRERYAVVEQFNETHAEYPASKLIHELFEEQVGRTPGTTAVMYGDQRLTYAELDVQANVLAQHLRKRGVGPDERVAICVDRSVEMLVGLLAVLKSGGAYVPLDPHYPPERLKYMLEDSVPRVVLVGRSQQGLSAQPEVVIEDAVIDGSKAYGAGRDRPADVGLAAQHLVYVIYTSGSTGRPKGVAMSHGSMQNLLEWHRRNFKPAAGTRVLQFAALSFDVAFQEIFSTLTTGGTLVLLDEWVRRDAKALNELLCTQKIQRLFVPPMMLQSLAEHSARTGVRPSTLEDIITAGEQLRVTDEITTLLERLPGCRLHNHYGPTETHVVTALTLEGHPGDWPRLPSIGRPVSNTQIYVLNDHRQPTPVGVPGELYIAGANVSRGYLSRPEMTADRFVANPFSSDGNARMYKTGDRARWLANGTVEYLGRNDDQVKIRGYRIELGEIETQLARCDGVKDAAVIAREDALGTKRLLAYVTALDQAVVTAEALREQLRGLLPEHMIPSVFTVLERLPQTPTGKLDRRALPDPVGSTHSDRQFDAPQGDIEQAIAEIWNDLLGVREIGRHDNFFDLGGHSLIATRVASHIAQVLEIDVPVRVIFEEPTVERLGGYIVREIEAELMGEAG